MPIAAWITLLGAGTIDCASFNLLDLLGHLLARSGMIGRMIGSLLSHFIAMRGAGRRRV